MNILNQIENRISTRTYSDVSIELEEQNKLQKLVKDLNERSEHFRFVLAFENENQIELGTYGFIVGAKNYLFATAKLEGNKKELSFLFGMIFEEFILECEKLDLGTCWMAGTYDRKQVSEFITLSEDEFVCMVTPIGYKMKMRIKEKAMRKLVKADKRKNSELLFKNLDGSTLTEDNPDILKALEMLRKAPSAKNIQPWRVFKDDNQYHFYGVENTDYQINNFNLVHNDVGIAYYHFTKTLEFLNISFSEVNKKPQEIKSLVYLKTVVIN